MKFRLDVGCLWLISLPSVPRRYHNIYLSYSPGEIPLHLYSLIKIHLQSHCSCAGTMVHINQLGLPQEFYPSRCFFVHRCSRCKVAWTHFGQLLAVYKAVKARAICKWNTSWTEGRLEPTSQNTHGLSTMLTFLCDTRHLLVRQRVPMTQGLLLGRLISKETWASFLGESSFSSP